MTAPDKETNSNECLFILSRGRDKVYSTRWIYTKLHHARKILCLHDRDDKGCMPINTSECLL